MSVYLHDIPITEAQDRFQSELEQAGLWKVLSKENILLDEDAAGRVLAELVWAKISSPHYHASAMDGYAVLASSTLGAQPSNPITLQVRRGPDLSNGILLVILTQARRFHWGSTLSSRSKMLKHSMIRERLQIVFLRPKPFGYGQG